MTVIQRTDNQEKKKERMATEDGQTDDKSPGNLTCAYLVPIGQKNIPEKKTNVPKPKIVYFSGVTP